MNVLLVIATLLGYQVGETYRAALQRIGLILEKNPVNAVCVYTSPNYNVFAVYDSTEITSIINPIGNRLVITMKGRKPLTTGNWTDRVWGTFKVDLSDNSSLARFYKETPPNKSRWYFLSGSYFQRGRGLSCTKVERFFVITATGDTAKPLYDLQFHPIYIDSVIYLATGKGVFRGVADTTDTTWQTPFYHWTWKRVGTTLTDTVVTLLVVSDSELYAGTPSGVYRWDDSTWTFVLPHRIYQLIQSPTTSKIYALTHDGVYVTTDGITWGPFGLQGIPTLSGAFKEDTLLVGTLGHGVYQTLESFPNFTSRSTGIADRFYAQIGGLDILSLYVTSQGELFAGTRVGIFQWIDGRWVNIAGNSPEQTVGMNLSTEIIDSAVTLLSQQMDQAYLQVQNTVADSFDVPPELVYPDFDSIPGVNVLIGAIFEYVNTESNIDMDYSPLWGYFDPSVESDPDQTLRDYFVVNVSSSQYKGPRYLGLDDATRLTFLKYMLSKMAMWQADHGEELFLITGLALLNTLWAGGNIVDSVGDTKGLLPGLAYATQFNSSLTQGSVDHPFATEMREVDRERLFLFMEYLYEKYGLLFISDLATSTLHGLHSIEYALSQEGDSLSGILIEWALANFYDSSVYAFVIDSTGEIDTLVGDTTLPHYKNIDVTISPMTITPNKSRVTIGPYALYYFQDSRGYDPVTGDTVYQLSFNAEDGATFVIYRLGETPDIQEWDSTYKIFQVQVADTTPTAWVVVNIHNNTYQFALARDLQPPEEVGLYTIQNSVFNTTMDFFILGTEALYSDVNQPTPIVVLTNIRDTSQQQVQTFPYSAGDTTYVYNGHLQLYSEGIFEVSLIAGDEVGNWASFKPDTIVVLTLSPQGGTLTLFNGRLKLEYAPGAVASDMRVLFDELGSNDLPSEIPVPAVRGYVIGNGNVVFAHPMTLQIDVSDLEDLDEFGLFRWDGQSLEPIPYVFSNGKVTAEISSFGLYFLAKGQGIQLPERPKLLALSQKVYSRLQPLTLTFAVPTRQLVELEVYDVSGRRIQSIYRGIAEPGFHRVDVNTSRLPSGLYLLTFKVGQHLKQTERFILQ